MSDTKISVNPRIFPLPLVKSALYVLCDRIDGRLDENGNGWIDVILTPIEEKMTSRQVERTFNQALIAASVNERAFQMAGPIRNYLAQSAFSITNQNQQTIQEFVAGLADERSKDHMGSPISHVDVSTPEDDPFTPTQNDNRLLVDAEQDQVILRINTGKYLLPDVLQAAYEIRDVCDCAISYQPGNRLAVKLSPCRDDVDMDSLGAVFEHRLNTVGKRRLWKS